MKPEDKNIIEILIHIAEGKEWEYLVEHYDQWASPISNSLLNAMDHLSTKSKIRIKPEPKMRPLRVDELNPVEVYKVPGFALPSVWYTSDESKQELEHEILECIERGTLRSTDGGKIWTTFEVECKEGE